MSLESIAIEIVRFFVIEKADDEFVLTYKNKRIKKTNLGYEIQDYPLNAKEFNYIEILLNNDLYKIFNNEKEGTWLPNWDDLEVRFEKLLSWNCFKYFQPDPFTIIIERI